MTTPDPAAIKAALSDIYGEGEMVGALAIHLSASWAQYEAAATDVYHSVKHQVYLTIWNWFPGGGTALLASERVMEAVA